MTPDEFRAELEEELRWRQEELAFFKNQLVDLILHSYYTIMQTAKGI